MIRLQFDADGYSVICSADRVMLLAKEFALLRFLYDNRNQVFTREQLLDRVYRWNIRWSARWMIISTDCVKSSSHGMLFVFIRSGGMATA